MNGEVKQDGNTDEMMWDMHYLVADIARTITLVPGDVILSGTPANSRPVQPGDVVEVEVEGLGTLRNRSWRATCRSVRTSALSRASPRRSSRRPSAATGSSAASAHPVRTEPPRREPQGSVILGLVRSAPKERGWNRRPGNSA